MKKIPWVSLATLAALWGLGSWCAWNAVHENAFDAGPVAAAAFIGVGLLLCLFQVFHGLVRRKWMKVGIFLVCPVVFFAQMAVRGLLRWPS